MNKILISTIIALSIFLMAEVDVLHHHNDGAVHNECPVCVLTILTHSLAIITVSVFILRPLLNPERLVIKFNNNISNNFSYCFYPERAPPTL